MQKPELEDLGEMPSVSRSGWRGMYTANGGTMRGAALQRGAAELETQGKELSALELYIQRAQENARKAGDYLRYSGTEESENSYRDALEAYQRAVDAYNEGAKEYNSGLTAFRNTEEVKLSGRTEGKSYGELQKMIEDTADELDRTQDENQRGDSTGSFSITGRCRDRRRRRQKRRRRKPDGRSGTMKPRREP